MKFNVPQLAVAAALTMGITYLFCALIVGMWPDIVLTLMESLFHLSNLKSALGEMVITFGGFFSGLVQTLLYTYIVGYGFGWLYNFLADSKLTA